LLSETDRGFSDGIELGFIGLGFVCVPIAILIYIRINARRDAAAKDMLENGEKSQLSEADLKERGDRAPDFRYSL
jgi:hypothetical protein